MPLKYNKIGNSYIHKNFKQDTLTFMSNLLLHRGEYCKYKVLDVYILIQEQSMQTS